MSEVWKNYELVRYSIQLVDTKLFSLQCSFTNAEEGTPLAVSLGHRLEHDPDNISVIEVFLNVSLDGPFKMEVVYQGTILITDSQFDKEVNKKTIEDLIVPFLLPYARECIASTLSRMQLPIYTLPTIDILQSLLANNNETGE